MAAPLILRPRPPQKKIEAASRSRRQPHHHRALVQARQGRRERLTLKRQAGGLPFDNGEFELHEEPLEAPWPAEDPLHFTAAKIVWPSKG